MSFRGLVVVLSSFLLGAPSGAEAVPSGSQTLAQQISALEQQLAEARLSEAEETRARELNHLTAVAAHDAADRSFYLGGNSSLSFAPGKGLTFIDEETGNSMRLGFYTQFRYNASFQDGSTSNPAGNVDAFSSGFEFRRTRLYLLGQATKDLDYFILMDFGPSGRMGLQDANFTYHFNEEWCLVLGQFPMPLLNELTIPVPNQLMVELSSTLGIFNPERTQGLMVQYRDEQAQFILGYIEGPGGKNTDWNSDLSEFGVMTRGEWKLAGDWKQFEDFTSTRDTEFGAVLGAGMHYQEGDVGDGATPGSVGATAAAPTPNLVIWTVDGQFEWPGFNVYGAVTGRHTHPEGPNPLDTDDYTYLAQAGYYLTDNLELIGRYEHLDLDGVEEVGIATVGFIRYLAGNAHKITVDGGFTTAGVPVQVASDRVGLEVDAADADRQFFLRAQWQIVF
jgi:phosphate-selective porin OprO and OprP